VRRPTIGGHVGGFPERMTSRRATETVTLAPLDNRALANLCGPLDANLRQIEAALDVAISHRGAEFAITGPAPQATRAARRVPHAATSR